jgi:hypothetical protein
MELGDSCLDDEKQRIYIIGSLDRQEVHAPPDQNAIEVQLTQYVQQESCWLKRTNL